MKRRMLLSVLVLLVIPIYGQEVTAPTAAQTLNGVNPGDWFGKRMAADGNTVVLGLPGTDIARGSVEIYERAGDTWVLSQTLLGTEINRRFGYAVAIYGDTLVVGEPGYRGTLENAGRVTIYTRNGGTWTLAQTLDGADRNDEFGYSVDVSESAMVIGAPKHGDDDRGRVYLYNGSGGAWTESATFEGEPGKLLGNVVAVDGDTAIAAEGQNLVSQSFFNTQEYPLVYIFERSDAVWQNSGQLNGEWPDPQYPWLINDPPDGFGASLAIEGDTLVVGAPQNWTLGFLPPFFSKGEVMIYRRDETGWVYSQTLTDENDDEFFGGSLALSNNYLNVGATGRHTINEAGYIFFPVPLYYFTASTAYDLTPGTVYTYRQLCGTFTLTETQIGASNGDAFGFSVALTDQVSVIGAPLTENTGQVTIQPYNAYAAASDVNLDGVVSPSDTVFVVNHLGEPVNAENCPADVDTDGDIDTNDIDRVLATLGVTP